MTARIAELEKQLADTQQNLRLASSASTGTSRILENSSREPDAPLEDQLPNLVDAVGSLAINIHTEGGTKYYGSTSSSEYLSTLLPGDGTEGVIERLRDPKYLGVPEEILQLVYAFPLGIRDCPYDKSIFLPFFPPRDRAQELADLYFEMDAWQFTPVLRREIEEILNLIYGSSYPIIDSIHPHKLSVFFSIMAQGLAFSRETAASLVQEQYHSLACALVALEPITRGVTCSTVQSFYLIVRFLNTTVRTAAEDCWLIFGICVRVAQVMGLQYDGSAWNLEKEEIQRRRTLFWEIYTWSSWNAFIMGRPPSIYLEDTACKFPDNDADPAISGNELGFHAWKYRYTAACLPWTLKHAFSPGSVSYEVLMELDRKIRTFVIPSKLQVSLQGGEGLPWSSNARLAMQQCNCIFMKEANLLYLHRSFFAIALRDDPVNPLSHKFSPSVVASYRSARRMCVALRGLYLVHAEPLGRFWYFWSCIFSSCIVLSTLVYGSPGCSFAQEALMELNNAASFYEEGSVLCRPPKSMYVLAKLKRRAREAFTAFHAPGSSRGVTEPSPSDWDTCGDALGILGGAHGVVNHPTTAADSPGTSHSSGHSRSSQSPKAPQHFVLGPQTSYERARDPVPAEIPTDSMANQIPMQYDASMHGIQTTPMQSAYLSSLQSTSNNMMDQSMHHLGSLGYYEYGFGAPSDARVQVRPEFPGTPNAPNRQHIWKSFIEGLMDDAAA
ncbi:hypothetical protein EUX98_g851 [Antrodiella citrinella]|uniref:Xylanolytic transcriptional activator regulatory domain-containing protein n=1 Tax=Antrodiella citrinella TaxID=2447956 RepID=A0A4S4N637_9APHY|nr:hypothetical protein EUX98_g851 [Antrodiella citrinella]